MLRWLLATTLLIAGAAARADVSDVRFSGLAGGDIALGAYAGRPVLIANTASLCGFTRQYAGLQAIWDRYRDDGLVVIGVPTNDFGNQEPGTAAEIKAFCEVNFAIDFPLAAKASTRGADRHTFFAEVEAALGVDALPRWNFHKYLVGPDGTVDAAWPSHVEPTAPEITAAIEAALAGPASAGHR